MYDFEQFLINLKENRELEFEISKPLSSVSAMGVGGEADFFILPRSLKVLAEVLTEARQLCVPYVIVGNSSNIIYSDKGFKGSVISTRLLDKIIYSERGDSVRLCCETGVMLPRLSELASELGCTGFEGLCSIPGTVGGAVMSNAGAFGQEISDCIYGMFILMLDGRICFRRADKSGFSYRKCNILSDGDTVLSVMFSVKHGEKENILNKMKETRQKRRDTQPVGIRSAGSFFKRPNVSEASPYFRMSAGELIDRCGLKGLRLGGAEVSKKHANFIVNREGATSDDVLRLAELIKKTVFEKTGVMLCEETVFVS